MFFPPVIKLRKKSKFLLKQLEKREERGPDPCPGTGDGPTTRVVHVTLEWSTGAERYIVPGSVIKKRTRRSGTL